MPPFSAGLVTTPAALRTSAAKGFLPNSMKLFWPEKPCQPSVPNQKGGSTRPVDPPAVSPAAQSAVAQYRAPGTRRGVGKETCSLVFASIAPMVELAPGSAPGAPQSGEPSAGPPASYTTCPPVVL